MFAETSFAGEVIRFSDFNGGSELTTGVSIACSDQSVISLIAQASERERASARTFTSANSKGYRYGYREVNGGIQITFSITGSTSPGEVLYIQSSSGCAVIAN